MKHWSAFALLLPVLISGCEREPTRSSQVAAPTVAEPIRYGIYDPGEAFSDAPAVAIEHIFVSWSAFDPAELVAKHSYTSQRSRQLLVTVEPFGRPGTDPADLLPAVLRGEYDAAIQRICRAVAAIPETVLVRWGHEMETGRYPWAGRKPAHYTGAYRHFVSVCRKMASNISFVWSPIGEPILDAYYPGHDYVDIIGLPLWGIEEKRRHPTFASAFQLKYRRVAAYGRPVIIAEFGVMGSYNYRAAWITELDSSTQVFPLLKAVVYFNAKDPFDYKGQVGKPDWQISPEKFPRRSGII